VIQGGNGHSGRVGIGTRLKRGWGWGRFVQDFKRRKIGKEARIVGVRVS